MREDQYYNNMNSLDFGFEKVIMFFARQMILHLRMEHQMTVRDIAKRMNMKMKEVAAILEESV